LKPFPVRPEVLANNSFDPVPCDRFSDALRYGNTKARRIVLIWTVIGDEVSILRFLTLPRNMKKRDPSAQSVRLGVCIFAQQIKIP